MVGIRSSLVAVLLWTALPALAADPTTGNDAESSNSLVNERIERERAAQNNRSVLLAHKRNYLLPLTYNSNINEEAWTDIYPDAEMDDVEAKFQISLKAIIWEDILGEGTNLWGAYTQENWWQVYNSDESAPSRETNYQPEVTLTFENDWEIFGFTNTLLGVSLNHQSNGRGELLSRSWNRVFAEFIFVRDDFGLSFKPWYRIPESSSSDDNPDIEDYLGNYEFKAYQRWHGHDFSLMLRNIFDSDNRYNAELQWSFPIKRRLRGLVQWYNGYGENLIDHDHKNNRIGIGLLMTDWL